MDREDTGAKLRVALPRVQAQSTGKPFLLMPHQSGTEQTEPHKDFIFASYRHSTDISALPVLRLVAQSCPTLQPHGL